MAEREYSRGYLAIKPRLGKLTVTNLVNFAEADGVYGVAPSGIVRIGKSALYFVIYAILCLFLNFLIGNWFIGILVWILLLPLPFRLISIFVFNEKKVKKDYQMRKELKNKDFESMYHYMFGLYDMDETFPYIAYVTDGSFGVYLRCVRKSQVGSIEEKAFNHSAELGAFYNQCATLGLVAETIDIQASNSYDERFDILYDHLNEVSSPTMQVILASMYHHLEDDSTSSQLTHEYFFVRGTGDPGLFWDNVTQVMGTLRRASYKRVQVMDSDQVGVLIGETFGIEEFPMREAMSQAVRKSGKSSLKLLWVGDAQGHRKNVAVSRASREAEMARKAQEAEMRKKKQAQEAEKAKAYVVTTNTQLDIFEPSSGSSSTPSGMTGILDVEEPAVGTAKGDDVDLFGGSPTSSFKPESSKSGAVESLDFFEGSGNLDRGQ